MRLLLSLILLLLPLPALADVTARYSSGKTGIVVAVDDQGNARIDFENKASIIRRDDTDYVVINLLPGDAKVTTLADFVSVLSDLLAKEPAPQALQTPGKFTLSSSGDASIAGFAGTRWAFGPEREADGRPGEMLEFVISADPALQPVGALFRRIVATVEPLVAALMPQTNDFYPMALDLAGKGAPLRIGKTELQSVSNAKIEPKRFELPGQVIPATEVLNMFGPSPSIELQPLP